MAATDWSGERAAKEKKERVALRVGVSVTLRQNCFKKGDDGGSGDDGEVEPFQLAVLQPKILKMKKSCRTNNGKQFTIFVVVIIIITIIIVLEYLFQEKDAGTNPCGWYRC